MFEELYNSENFIRLALILQASGFLVRDELRLRTLVMLGSVCSVLYYFYITDAPLWDAIVGSSILAIINLAMICVLIFERTTLAMSLDQEKAFGKFTTLSPGQFRKLFRLGTLVETTKNTKLSIEGERNTRLFLVLEGDLTLVKDGQATTMRSPCFIGEVGFILDDKSTADVSIPKGGKYVEWEYQSVRNLMNRKSDIHNAMIALFSSDLANKLGRSFPTASSLNVFDS